MKILVTGGAGFIGSNLVERLLQDGHNVVCIDNFDDFYDSSIKEENIKIALQNSNYNFIKADITDLNKIDQIFKNNKFDIVIHLAAKAGVRPSIIDPYPYYNVNVIGTMNILESMKKHDVKKLIFASSSSVYGNNINVPFSEKDIVDNPISPYAASKKAGELLCHTYHHLYNFNIFCLRLFTVYGPRQRPDLAIHKFTEKIIKELPIDIYGKGDTARDYTYVDDIIQGITKSIEKIKGFEIINLGESRTILLSELIKVLEKTINKKAILNYQPMQAGDVDITYANISKAKALLDYSPNWDFEKGIIEFIKWKKI